MANDNQGYAPPNPTYVGACALFYSRSRNPRPAGRTTPLDSSHKLTSCFSITHEPPIHFISYAQTRRPLFRCADPCSPGFSTYVEGAAFLGDWQEIKVLAGHDTGGSVEI